MSNPFSDAMPHNNDNKRPVQPKLSSLFATERQLDKVRPFSVKELSDASNDLMHKLSRDFNEFFEQGESNA